jgi:hypothetical protein
MYEYTLPDGAGLAGRMNSAVASTSLTEVEDSTAVRCDDLAGTAIEPLDPSAMKSPAVPWTTDHAPPISALSHPLVVVLDHESRATSFGVGDGVGLGLTVAIVTCLTTPVRDLVTSRIVTPRTR